MLTPLTPSTADKRDLFLLEGRRSLRPIYSTAMTEHAPPFSIFPWLDANYLDNATTGVYEYTYEQPVDYSDTQKIWVETR
jgi:hypothetical protein